MKSTLTRIDKNGIEINVEVDWVTFDDLHGHSGPDTPNEVALKNAEVGTRFKIDGTLYGKRRVLHLVVERIEELDEP